jgi:hypothetical protein
MHYVDCCDFTIASEIAWPVSFPASREPEVEIRYRNLPTDLGEGGERGFRFHAKPNELLICVDGVARYLIRGGKEIWIEPFPYADEDSIFAFLQSSVLGVLLLQRRFLVLNGGVLNVDGEGLALVGRSRAGKSTLAAAFQRIGASLFSDELCAVKQDSSGHMMAWPVLPALSLWENTLIQQGGDVTKLRPIRPSIRKYLVPTHAKSLSPVPLTKVVELKDYQGGLLWKTVDVKEALTLVLGNTYRHRFLAGMALKDAHFLQSSALIQQSCFYIAQRNLTVTSEDAFFHFVRTSLAL